jgi:hypothetical protein
MLLSVLAAAAVIAGANAAPQAPIEQAVAKAVIVDCQVSGANLTDCKAVDADGADAVQAQKLAEQVEVPEAFALANPGRVLIKMKLTP